MFEHTLVGSIQRRGKYHVAAPETGALRHRPIRRPSPGYFGIRVKSILGFQTGNDPGFSDFFSLGANAGRGAVAG